MAVCYCTQAQLSLFEGAVLEGIVQASSEGWHTQALLAMTLLSIRAANSHGLMSVFQSVCLALMSAGRAIEPCRHQQQRTALFHTMRFCSTLAFALLVLWWRFHIS